MAAYYNDNDPFVAQWLRNLIARQLIAPGYVDERDLRDVQPGDLAGYTQCHFFAGIGGWSHALRLAGWPDARSAWTGSCPCQPFSAAGKQAGTKDERHLWPEFFRLIRQCRPDTVFGEQVAAAVGHDWLDHVSTDLEGEGYAVGSIVLGAHSVGAPHRRQRLWFVADSKCGSAERWGHDLGAAAQSAESEAQERQRVRDDARASRVVGELADSDCLASGQGCTFDGRRDTRGDEKSRAGLGGGEHAGELGNAKRQGLAQQRSKRGASPEKEGTDTREAAERAGAPTRGFWNPADWLPCRDGKARPVEPGTFPLAHGVPARVGRLRGYGNAIVPQVAAQFIRAMMP